MVGCIKVSVVFPAYNEARRIEHAVKETVNVLGNIGVSYEIIIAEDGSTDGTDKIAAALAERYMFVKHLHGHKRLGRGVALNNAFRQSSGAILVYMDVDLSTNVRQLPQLINAVKEEGFDIAVGSRLLPESKVERTRARTLTSKIYNFFVRLLLGSKVRDHQCGFKAFRREVISPLLGAVRAHHWFWDTELLVRAMRNNLTVKEIPVEWHCTRETKVRLFKDSFGMFLQVVQLWWQLKHEYHEVL
ncbi:MAG: glycosyltransferase family 2 protein [Candidatus Bathyarchaeia archaeon]